MGWLVMNHNNSSGTLNINRLIEEAEALLLGERPQSCTNCGDCKSDNCIDKRIKHAIRRPLATATK